MMFYSDCYLAFSSRIPERKAPQEVAEAHVAWEAAELTRYDSSDPGATAAARVVVERLLLGRADEFPAWNGRWLGGL